MAEAQEIRQATELLFNERKDFIVIGLTGRTGSGCSLISNFLTKEFEELTLPSPKDNEYNNNEERKYKVVYKYAKENWAAFRLIEVKNIIVSFILEDDYERFIKYINDNLKFTIPYFDKLINSLNDNLKIEFNELHKIRIKVKNEMEKDRDKSLSSDLAYSFYFEDLPRFTNKLQKTLNDHDPNLYTLIFQNIGNNIRKSGLAYEIKFEPQNIYKLSQRINVLIKILRRRNIKIQKRILIVIDAIRNPHEAVFFKERYSAFYLFSVNCDNKDRIDRLINKGLNKKQIEKLDKQEYPQKLIGVNKFISQNIGRCIELADIHLFNPNDSDYSIILKQIIRYVTLIMHPGIVTPTHIERCMQVAYDAKLNSGCMSRQVGAVVTDVDYSVKSIGWNNPPEGQVQCNLRDIKSLLNCDDKLAFSDFEYCDELFSLYLNQSCKHKIDDENLKGRMFSYCFKDAYNAFEDKKNQVHTRALHGEENAFLQIAKYGGVGLKGGYLFTTASPCELCAKKAFQLGIKKIYYIDPYPGISEKHVLSFGKDRPEMQLYEGAIGRAYHALYTPIIPYKDEINMLLDFEFIQKK